MKQKNITLTDLTYRKAQKERNFSALIEKLYLEYLNIQDIEETDIICINCKAKMSRKYYEEFKKCHYCGDNPFKKKLYTEDEIRKLRGLK